LATGKMVARAVRNISSKLIWSGSCEFAGNRRRYVGGTAASVPAHRPLSVAPQVHRNLSAAAGVLVMMTLGTATYLPLPSS
jgi:hypothetical protein